MNASHEVIRIGNRSFYVGQIAATEWHAPQAGRAGRQPDNLADYDMLAQPGTPPVPAKLTMFFSGGGVMTVEDKDAEMLRAELDKLVAC